MANFYLAVERVLKIEGKYSDRAADSGGKTNFGITWLTARSFGYLGLMKNLTKGTAIDIYKKQFWDKLNLGLIDDQELAEKIFDINVNCGNKVKKYLQRSLNVFNRYGVTWPDIKVDGKIGKITISTVNRATKSYMSKRNIIKSLNCLQGVRYIELAENKNRKDELNINGWFNKRIS